MSLQICGASERVAIKKLEGLAPKVLARCKQVKAVRQQWSSVEGDLPRLSGSHLLGMASLLHVLIAQLERCSQRVQRMTEQTLVFKSVKKVMDKLLSILAEVEQAHRAFFHSFETAVQASLQEGARPSPSRSTLQRTPLPLAAVTHPAHTPPPPLAQLLVRPPLQSRHASTSPAAAAHPTPGSTQSEDSYAWGRASLPRPSVSSAAAASPRTADALAVAVSAASSFLIAANRIRAPRGPDPPRPAPPAPPPPSDPPPPPHPSPTSPPTLPPTLPRSSPNHTSQAAAAAGAPAAQFIIVMHTPGPGAPPVRHTPSATPTPATPPPPRVTKTKPAYESCIAPGMPTQPSTSPRSQRRSGPHAQERSTDRFGEGHPGRRGRHDRRSYSSGGDSLLGGAWDSGYSQTDPASAPRQVAASPLPAPSSRQPPPTSSTNAQAHIHSSPPPQYHATQQQQQQQQQQAYTFQPSAASHPNQDPGSSRSNLAGLLQAARSSLRDASSSQHQKTRSRSSVQHTSPPRPAPSQTATLSIPRPRRSSAALISGWRADPGPDVNPSPDPGSGSGRATAERLLLLSAAGDVDAMAALSMMLRVCVGWPGMGDLRVARGLLAHASAAGSRDAAYAVGEMAERGEGGVNGEVDYGEAAVQYHRAAKLGSQAALTRYARLVEQGRGVRRDEHRAARLYIRAANAGDATAANNLAEMLFNGRAMVADHTAAVAMFARAAGGGSSAARYNLGTCCYHGYGTPRDRAAAQRHFESAAAAGHPRASLWVGQSALDAGCYSLGYSHLCNAAAAGVREALFCLAELAEKQATALLAVVRAKPGMTSSPGSRSSDSNSRSATAVADGPVAQAELLSLDFARFANLSADDESGKGGSQVDGGKAAFSRGGGSGSRAGPMGPSTPDGSFTTHTGPAGQSHLPPRSKSRGSLHVPGSPGTTLQLSQSGRLFLREAHQQDPNSRSRATEASGSSPRKGVLQVAQAAAAQLYARAAADGEPRAQHWLGNLNWQNDRLDAALDCYYAAAKLGHPPSLILLGCLSEGMYGFETDLSTAEKCYRLAASKGHAGAEKHLHGCKR
ncbi:MAG: hypothetical protein WDW36_007334 [Sanguina aurantia]